MTPRLAALALVPVLLAGCGGDDRLGKAELVTRSEALCAEANGKIDAQQPPATPDQVDESLRETLDIADDYTTRLERLAATAEDEAEVKEIFLTPLRGQVEALRKFIPQVAAAGEKGQAAIEALADPDLPEADLDAMRTFGFDACLKTAQSE